MARTEIKPEFLGLAAINPFIANVSSPRAVMDSSHMSSHLPLLNPDERLIKTGIEYELGKYVNDIKSDHDYIVKAIIPRYQSLDYDVCPSFTILAEYEDKGCVYFDFIDVNKYNTSHTFFGYLLRKTAEFENLSYNSPLPKDTILAKTDSYGKEGSYDYGLSAKVAFMTHPGVAEDGFVVSESFLERAKFTSIIKRVINITKDTIPVNLYGNKEKFKFIPDIGEDVRPDGLLCALRERNDWYSISDLSDQSLSEVDIIFDNLVYVGTNSKVIDVKVIKGNNKPEFSNQMTEKLDEMADALLNYYKTIIQKYEQFVQEKKALYGRVDIVKLTPRASRFITDSMIKVNVSTSNKTKLCCRKLPIDQYRIEITIMSVITPKLGFKMTDIFGAKGVICDILPDEQMPVDKNGVRAEVITDSSSTISRMNLGRAYELYLGSVCHDCRQHILNYLQRQHTSYDKHQLTEHDLLYIKDYLHGIYKLINPDMEEFITSLNVEELIHHIDTIVNEKMYLYYPTDNEYNITDVISNIEKSPYKPLNDKVTYVDYLGRTVETKENIRIGELYMMFLEKIANTYSAVSSSKVNNFGFPIKGTNMDKYKYPHSLTPTKTLGETEVRILTAFAGPECIADMIDATLNPISHKYLIHQALTSDKPFDQQLEIDRNIIPYGQTKSIAILKHMFNAAGFDYEFVEDKVNE